MVTPMSVTELFATKTLPALVMCLLAVFPALLIAHAFDVPMRGNVATFVVLTAVFMVSAISIGVMIASVMKTLQQTLLVSFFGLFPLLFLSGTMVPIESMPRALQLASLVSPLRYYVEVILGVFLKGAGFVDLWAQTLALMAIGAVLFGFAVRMFRR